MSITVAAVQVPFHYSPFQKAGFSNISPSNNLALSPTSTTSNSTSRAHSSSADVSHARWSREAFSGESIAEDRQMSHHGSALRPSHDQQDREREREHYAGNASHPRMGGNVLPPISPTRSSAMEGPPGQQQQPAHSPGQRHPSLSDANTESRPPRLIGVHSILNPSHGDEDLGVRRRRASEMDDQHHNAHGRQYSNHTSLRPLSSITRGMQETSPPTQPGQPKMRRILTPISPRMQRAVSYGRVPGTIDATERPFLSDLARMSTPEHAVSNGAQPMPPQTSQVPQQSPFVVPAAPTPPLAHAQRRASVSVIGSTRPSPSPSYGESYSQSGMSGQTSPAMQPAHQIQPAQPQAPGSTPPGSSRMTASPNFGPMSNHSLPPGAVENEGGFHRGPVVSSGQNYQLLTVDTSKGHMQLPVEVQAASRMADEKRKRNAGASARFRARRKEKEREAASKISNLELELVHAQDDARFYRQERENLLDLLRRAGPLQYDGYMKSRAPSPRLNRAQLPPRPRVPSEGSPVDSEPYDAYDIEPPAPTRRRTEAYVFPPSPHANGPPPQQQQQHPHHHTHQYPPPSPYTYPPQQPQQQQQLPPLAHTSPPNALTRPPPAHDIHKQDAHPTYDRGWPPRGHAPPR